MTDNDLRGQIGQQLIAINGIESQISDADDTPNNQATQSQAEKARTALEAVYDSLPSDNETISSTVASNYNAANAQYKALVSVMGEFGLTSWPSFSDAVVESWNALPDTLSAWGNDLGSAVSKPLSGAGNFIADTIKSLLSGFFSQLGWFAYVLIGIAILGALTYFWPGWWKVLKR